MTTLTAKQIENLKAWQVEIEEAVAELEALDSSEHKELLTSLKINLAKVKGYIPAAH